MKILKKSPFTHTCIAVVTALAVLAAPALADAIAGCIMPLIPKKDDLMEQSWEPESLVLFLKKDMGLEFKSPDEKPIAVIPHYALFSRENSRRPLVAGEGTAAKISPGRHALGTVLSNDTAGRLSGALARLAKEDRTLRPPYRVSDARVLDHDERLRWSEGGDAALTLHVVDAKPRRGEEKTRSHMLVLFLTGSK